MALYFEYFQVLQGDFHVLYHELVDVFVQVQLEVEVVELGQLLHLRRVVGVLRRL